MYLSQPGFWQDPPKPLCLDKSDVHIWLAPLTSQGVPRLGAYLSADEQERANRFKFTKDRDAFIVARGTLRCLLAAYLAVQPNAIRFAYNRFGRPILADPPLEGLQFNVAHSGRLALYIVACRQVGIDVEQVRSGLDFDSIAASAFSRHEQAELRSVAEAERPRAFFNCWTRKEAYIKARGMGLQFPLDQFDVSCAPGKPARLLAVRSGDDRAERWSMYDLQLGDEYCGAAIVEGAAHPSYFWFAPDPKGA